jgi:hypothetical protein
MVKNDMLIRMGARAIEEHGHDLATLKKCEPFNRPVHLIPLPLLQMYDRYSSGYSSSKRKLMAWSKPGKDSKTGAIIPPKPRGRWQEAGESMEQR